jgi:hypothetical protein
MKTQITFVADSTAAILLECEYQFQRGDKQTWESPGYPDHVEVETVRAVEVDGEAMSEEIRSVIGELCMLANRKQIERSVLEAHSQSVEDERAYADEMRFQAMRDGD